MRGSVENIHTKYKKSIEELKNIIQKIDSVISLVINNLNNQIDSTQSSLIDTQLINPISVIKSLQVDDLITSLSELENSYNLAITHIIMIYYTENTIADTMKFYQIMSSQNFGPRLVAKWRNVRQLFTILCKYTHLYTDKLNEIDKNIMEGESFISRLDDRALSIKITKTKNNDLCKCGAILLVMREVSELRCSDETCGMIKTIWYNPDNDSNRSKRGGFESIKHFEFHIERLQALETKTFSEKVLAAIERVIKRDNYIKSQLNCVSMRKILKDPRVGAACLNDHVPRLVVHFGGASPPKLTFNEHKIASMRFSRAMELLEIINPGDGNRPYYMFFIYKILEEMFQNDPKIRILDYIHLQSRETVIKNDLLFKQICAAADKEDGLIYRATDPVGRC